MSDLTNAVLAEAYRDNWNRDNESGFYLTGGEDGKEATFKVALGDQRSAAQWMEELKTIQPVDSRSKGWWMAARCCVEAALNAKATHDPAKGSVYTVWVGQ